MKNYFVINGEEYYIFDNLPIDKVILMSDSILNDTFGKGKNVALYLRDFVIKHHLIKNATTCPVPDDIIESWNTIKCSELWKKINKTRVLRNDFYKTLLEDINRQIDYEATRYANKSKMDDILDTINVEDILKALNNIDKTSKKYKNMKCIFFNEEKKD